MGNLELSNDTQTDIHLQLYDHARLWTFKAERINEHALDCCYTDVSLSLDFPHTCMMVKGLFPLSRLLALFLVLQINNNNNKQRKGKIG